MNKRVIVRYKKVNGVDRKSTVYSGYVSETEDYFIKQHEHELEDIRSIELCLYPLYKNKTKIIYGGEK